MWVDQTLPKDHAITGSNLNLKEFIRILSETGYNGIEIMLGNPLNFNIKKVVDVVYSAGLEVSQLCTGEFWGSYNLCLNDINTKKRKKALSWAEQSIKFASILKCSVNIGRFRGKIWEDGVKNSMNRMLNSFRYLDKKAKEWNVELLIEPLRKDICDNINSVSEVASFINNNGLQSFRIMIDTDHTSIEEIGYIQSNFSNIKYIHLTDTMHSALGEGTIFFPKYFKLFKSLRYEGYMSIEVFSNNQDMNIAQDSISYLKKFIQRTNELWKYK
jgi:D-psicose/D-tagatose/L-ribulose 3-epimerase